MRTARLYLGGTLTLLLCGSLVAPAMAQAGPRVLKEGSWGRLLPRIRGFTPQRHGGRLLFAPDGSVWLEGSNGKFQDAMRIRLARRDEDGWSRVKTPPDPFASASRPLRIRHWGATGDGVLYAVRGAQDVQRFDGTKWETLARPGGDLQRLHVAADGTVWVETRGGRSEATPRTLHRLRADGYTWATHDVGAWHGSTHYYSEGHPAAVGPDGAYWFAPGDGGKVTGTCDGVARHDGTTTTRFLQGLCIYDLTIGPDGDAWVLAGEWEGSIWDPDEVGPVGVYVVRADPESGPE